MAADVAGRVHHVVVVDEAVARRRAARDLCRLANEVADVVDRPGWHQRAACRDMGPAVFFPDTSRSTGAARIPCSWEPGAAS